MKQFVEPHQLPAHIRRHIKNQRNVPHGHFTVLQEITFFLTGPLFAEGYELSDHFLPDGSLGRMFCSFLKSNNIDPIDFPTYKHYFDDGRIVTPKAYPNWLLGTFRDYVENIWLPGHLPSYLEKRAPEAMPYLMRIPAMERHKAKLLSKASNCISYKTKA